MPYATLLPALQLVGVISKKDLSKGGALVKVSLAKHASQLRGFELALTNPDRWL